MVLVRLAMGRFEEAAGVTEGARDVLLEHSSHPPVQMALREVDRARVAHEAEAKLAPLREAVATDPKSAEAQLRLGEGLREAQKFGEAVDALIESMRLDGKLEDGAAKAAVLKVCEEAGEGSAVATDARRKLSRVLFI